MNQEKAIEVEKKTPKSILNSLQEHSIVLINLLTIIYSIALFLKQYTLGFIFMIICLIISKLDSIYSDKKQEKQWLEMKETEIKHIRWKIETLEQQWQDRNNERTS